MRPLGNIHTGKPAIKDLTYNVEDTKILENINFSISDGEKIGLVGNIGSGKTTLLRTLIGFYLPSIVSKYAYFSKNSKIDEGSIVMHGVVVNAFSSIGKNCIINTNSTIEHDVKIGNNCHIAGGAVINGGVIIGDGTFIGSGTVVKQSVKIGRNCIISANTFVRKDIKNNQIFLR